MDTLVTMTCTHQQEDSIEFAALLCRWRRIMHHCSVSKASIVLSLSVLRVYLILYLLTCSKLSFHFVSYLVSAFTVSSRHMNFKLNFQQPGTHMWYWFKIDLVGQNTTYWHFILRQSSICIQSSTLLQLKKRQLCEDRFSRQGKWRQKHFTIKYW